MPLSRYAPGGAMIISESRGDPQFREIRVEDRQKTQGIYSSYPHILNIRKKRPSIFYF
jgi:hypothetical protein